MKILLSSSIVKFVGFIDLIGLKPTVIIVITTTTIMMTMAASVVIVVIKA
jgi:hypothetical protein